VEVVPRPDSGERDNLIFNGSFERPPLNAGLDWRFGASPFLNIDFSDPAAYQGTRCLRLDFTVGRNETFVGPHQFVPVDPNHAYVLQAYVKTQNITSDSGPRLQAVDQGCPACMNFLSDSTVGTTPWHLLSLKVLTGPKTQLIDIVVLRLPSRSFPNEITGSFWIDSVSLKASGPEAEEVSMRPAH
jgi:hypothetical protein